MSLNQFADSGPFSAGDTQAVLDFKPRRSVLLARFLFAVHALAVVTVLLWVPGRAAVAVLLALIALSFFRNYRRHVLHRGQRAPRRVVCDNEGSWLLQDQCGEMHPARLSPSSYLHPRLVILNFALDHHPRRRNLVLCPDSLDAQTLRQLRAHLRVVNQRESESRARLV